MTPPTPMTRVIKLLVFLLLLNYALFTRTLKVNKISSLSPVLIANTFTYILHVWLVVEIIYIVYSCLLPISI